MRPRSNSIRQTLQKNHFHSVAYLLCRQATLRILQETIGRSSKRVDREYKSTQNEKEIKTNCDTEGISSGALGKGNRFVMELLSIRTVRTVVTKDLIIKAFTMQLEK